MIKKIVSGLLCVSLLCVSMSHTAMAAEKGGGQTVYYDGMAFSYEVDEDGNIEVKGMEDGGRSYITVYTDGTAEAQAMNEDGQYIQYDLEMKELSFEEVDVVAREKNNRLGNKHRTHRTEHFDSVEDIVGKQYVGQALTLGWGVFLTTLVAVVIAVVGTIVVGGCIYYAVSTVIDKIQSDKAKQKYYYKAYIADYVTYIAFYNGTITQSQAASRIKSGQNVYTYTKALAKAAVVSAGLGCTSSPEIHLRKGYFAFYHYHTLNRNGAHSLYGLPYA